MRGIRRRRAPVTTIVRGKAGVGACALAAAVLAIPASGADAGQAQYLGMQWGLAAIGAPSAWQYGTGGGVRIGIVDTGVDSAQQDLQGKVVASAVFESSPSNGCPHPVNAEDDNGHGTHVAGIAAATGAYGVDGAAPGASLVVAKVLDCQGAGSYQDVVSGINWAVAQGAKVVNLSLGDAGTGLVDQSRLTGNPLAGALEDAWRHGAVAVIAGGNNANGVLGLGEGDFTNVPAVVVAATGPANRLASYSNSVDSAQWGVAAPGGDDPAGPTTPACGTDDKSEILSTYWAQGRTVSCYATDEGTSMATPFVSGTLALLLGRGLSPDQAVQTLLGTADHATSCGSDCAGLIQAGAAMAAASRSVSGSPSGPAATGTGAATAAPRPTPVPTQPPAQPGATTAPSTAAGSETTTTPPDAVRAGAAPATQAAAGHRRTSSAWWLVLPAIAGLLLLAGVGLVGRRLVLTRRSEEPPAG